jgi:hypothetical protein
LSSIFSISNVSVAISRSKSIISHLVVLIKY